MIKASDTVLQWDGISRELAAWNETQDLHSAMQNSVNWYFQTLDTAVGAEELEGFYRKIGYGNGSVGKDAAAYWKDGRLKISPLEQVMLLRKFYHNDWQMKQENLQAVKDALFLTERNGCRLYGKTGTGRTDGRDVSGWFVGYVESAETVSYTHLDVYKRQAKVFLISLKVGGTGLNLTAANVVIHVDPWWNAAAQNQATDRAYRMGQKKAVTVFKLITKNTLEEKIYELQIQKAALSTSVMGLSLIHI